MARPSVPHDVITSRGVKLDLVGRDVTLVFTFRSLALVEEHFGSVTNALTAMMTKQRQAVSTAQMLACALTHEVGDDGEPLSELDNLYAYLDTTRADDYQDAIVEALANAVPAVRKALDDADKDPQPDPTTGATQTPSSPGDGGITPPQSHSDEATENSG